jgi:hypothetical protein
MNSSQSNITSVSRDFFKYQYLIAHTQIVLESCDNSFSVKSSLFSKINFFALSSASSNNLSSLIIFPVLEENGPSLPEINQL